MLLLKLLLTPLLMLGVSLATRRWGHKVSGWLTGLPLIAGPIMAVLVIEQGAQFVVDTAIGTLVTLPGLAAYILAFGFASRRAGWLACLTVAWAAFFVVAAPLSQLPVNAHGGLAAAWLGLALAYLYTPRPREEGRAAHVPRVEIALRVGAAVALMLIVTFGANVLGPRYAGVLLSFPIGGSVLPAFTQALHGTDATAQMLRGFAIGLIPFPLFFYTLATGLPVAHPVLVFAGALAAIIVAHFTVLLGLKLARA